MPLSFNLLPPTPPHHQAYSYTLTVTNATASTSYVCGKHDTFAPPAITHNLLQPGDALAGAASSCTAPPVLVVTSANGSPARPPFVAGVSPMPAQRGVFGNGPVGGGGVDR